MKPTTELKLSIPRSIKNHRIWLIIHRIRTIYRLPVDSEKSGKGRQIRATFMFKDTMNKRDIFIMGKNRTKSTKTTSSILYRVVTSSKTIKSMRALQRLNSISSTNSSSSSSTRMMIRRNRRARACRPSRSGTSEETFTDQRHPALRTSNRRIRAARFYWRRRLKSRSKWTTCNFLLAARKLRCSSRLWGSPTSARISLG